MTRPAHTHHPEPGLNPIPQRMALLRRMGFHQQKVYDDHYQVATVYFWRVRRGVRDAVLAYSADECTGKASRHGRTRPPPPGASSMSR